MVSRSNLHAWLGLIQASGGSFDLNARVFGNDGGGIVKEMRSSSEMQRTSQEYKRSLYMTRHGSGWRRGLNDMKCELLQNAFKVSYG